MTGKRGYTIGLAEMVEKRMMRGSVFPRNPLQTNFCEVKQEFVANELAEREHCEIIKYIFLFKNGRA